MFFCLGKINACVYWRYIGVGVGKFWSDFGRCWSDVVGIVIGDNNLVFEGATVGPGAEIGVNGRRRDTRKNFVDVLLFRIMRFRHVSIGGSACRHPFLFSLTDCHD